MEDIDKGFVHRANIASESFLSTPSTPAGDTTNDTSTCDDENDDVDDLLEMPLDNGYLALGTIVLHRQEDEIAGARFTMHGVDGSEDYPNPWMTAATHRQWIRLDQLTIRNASRRSFLRVHILPEDVNRSNRGSLKDFRKFVKHLLSFVNRSVQAWLGTADSSIPHFIYEFPRTSQEESLFYIFNTLRSPSPNLDCFRVSTYGFQAVSDILNSNVAGLKTELYPYQRRSVSAMIQREAEPTKILDPRKPIYQDMYERSFYLDTNDGILLKHAPLYTEPQGGILAETMGYGKTLICIALVLATRGHYPKVPEARVDSLPFRPREKVGSLLAMAARRTRHEGIPWKAEFQALSKVGYQYDRCLEELQKYQRAYAEPIFTPTTPDRRGKRDSANIVRLCSATLVIVPPNLVVQWRHEIDKHTEQDALDVLSLDSPSKEVPEWQELLKYDIVIITKARFEQEYRDDDLHTGKTRRGEARYRSPLTDVRWLRVICDEGHGFAGSSSKTNAMAMLDKMYIERRWVVSGTPSSTLHGVEVGLSTTNSMCVDSMPGSPIPDTNSARKDSLSSALQKRRAPSAQDLETKDLERLRLIVVNFLQLQPWANQRGSSDVANWKKYLAPFADANGHRFSSPALREVLQTLIIRHRIEDIDTDLTLPPLHNRIVYLEPSYHDKLGINLFFLVLTSNYITSEREDEDYIFHPRNRKKLDLLINNMRQASFHWIGFSEHSIRETLRISNEYFNNNIDRMSDSDSLLMTEAIMNGERALADSSWMAFSRLHEIGVYVKGFPAHARESWALDGKGDDPVLLGTVQAREAQRYFRERLEKHPSDIFSSFAGAGVKIMNAAKSRAEEEQKAQQTNRTKSTETEKQQVGASEEPKLRAPSIPQASPSRSSGSLTPKKRRRSSSSLLVNLPTPPSSPADSPGHTPVPNTTILSFTSSKLTYLTTRILNLPSNTKSLVFYQHNNTAFFIAEALELLSIPFRIYSNTLSVAQRNGYLADFNSESSDIKVLLMDVKQASLGLHIACASYVCIVSPIWDAGVESQAIKRAHRIGQTKEVVVETLVLKATFEEEMVRRRRWKDENFDAVDDTPTVEIQLPSTAAGKNLKGIGKTKSGNQAGKGLLDDRHTVGVIKDIRFLKFNPDEREVGGRFKDMDIPVEKRLLFAPSGAVGNAGKNKESEQSASCMIDVEDDGLRTKFRKLDTSSTS